jgi:glycosyltransferase involved in cell wall biosynthesis
MNILVIAYYFPPFGGGASERVHHFVKNLPASGITPLVLTVDERFYEDIYHDPALLQAYSSEVRIFRSLVLFGEQLRRQKSHALANVSGNHGTSPGLARRVKKFVKGLIVPDEQVFWIPPALKTARKIFREHSVDAIITTGPPFSAHLLGAILSNKYNVPLILDYRDLWALNPFMAGMGAGDLCNRLLERFTIGYASHAVFTNQEAARAMEARYQIAPDRISVIENGFDDGAVRAAFASTQDTSQRGKLRINYLGSLTRKRSPRSFLAAVRRLMENETDLGIEIGFIGFVTAEHRQLVSEMGLESLVTFHGIVPKETALAMMCNSSDILLVLQRASEGGATAIPGKLYEYLATGKPILCLDEGLGATALFLGELGVEECVDYEDGEGIYRALRRLAREYDVCAARAGALREKMTYYDRKHLSRCLAALITDVVDKPTDQRGVLVCREP